MKELIPWNTTQDKQERKNIKTYSMMDFPQYEYIMKELISWNTSQDKQESKNIKIYSMMDFPQYSYRTPPLRKRARSLETSPTKFLDDNNSRSRRYGHEQLMG